MSEYVVIFLLPFPNTDFNQRGYVSLKTTITNNVLMKSLMILYQIT